MQRNVFDGVAIGVDRGMRHEERMRAIRAEMLMAASCPVTGDSPWFVLQVASGREKAVENCLTEAGVEALVPMRKGRERRVRHRIIAAPALPVILGYVFVRMLWSAEAMAGLLGVEHVVGMVGGTLSPHRVSAEEVSRFKAKADAGEYDWNAESEGFRQGQKVRITSGPFAHFMCKIVTCRTDGRGDAVVELDAFGRMKPILVPLAILEKI